MALHTVTVKGSPYLLQSYGDVIGDLPAAPQHESHRVWIDSIQLEFLSVNVGGTLLWRVSGGSGGPGSKYWVNAPGKSPTAPYTTVQAGLDAASADRIAEGNTGSYDVFVLPGNTFTETVTLRAGVNLIGLQTTPLATPPTINGSVTNEDVAMTVAVHGMAILKGVITAGTKAHNLVFEKCLITNAGVGFLDSNTHASSTYKLIDSTISADVGNFAIDMGSTGTLLAERCAIGNLVGGKALRTNAAVSIFRTCQFQGSRTVLATGAPSFINCEFDTDVNTAAFTQTAGSTVALTNCTEGALLEPVYSGTGTLKREGVNVYKAASSSASTITETGAGATVVWQTTKFSGLGPHTQNFLARAYLFLPGGGTAALNLLNTGNVPDHVPVTFINRDPAASLVQLGADAGNTIDGAATLIVQGSVTLIPDRATGTWFAASRTTINLKGTLGNDCASAVGDPIGTRPLASTLPEGSTFVAMDTSYSGIVYTHPTQGKLWFPTYSTQRADITATTVTATLISKLGVYDPATRQFTRATVAGQFCNARSSSAQPTPGGAVQVTNAPGFLFATLVAGVNPAVGTLLMTDANGEWVAYVAGGGRIPLAVCPIDCGAATTQQTMISFDW